MSDALRSCWRGTWLLVALLLIVGMTGGCRGREPTSPLSPLPSPTPGLEAFPLPLSGRVAFTSDALGNYDIYILDLAAGEARPIVTSPERDVDPAWSPAGDRLTFASARDNPDGLDIFLVNADGSDLTRLTTDPGFEVDPAWSPDGGSIAYHSNQSGDFEIYVYDLESGEATNVTNSPGIDYQADWSPDGRQIVFASQRTNRSEIWIMNRDGSNPRQVTDWPTSSQWQPRWSPDGRTILFVSDRDEAGGAIYAILAAGGDPVRLTPPGVAATNPAWALGGEAILFSASAQGEESNDLWVMTLSDRTPTLLWPGVGNDSYPVWTP
jgi:Tol biopolymer transport system component